MHAAEAIFWTSWLIIAYTYLVFPAALALLARTKRHELPDPATSAAESAADLPTVAMVIAAYNEAANLPAKLANTWEIDYPADRFHVVIGSDGSNDGTADVLGSCGDSRLRYHLFPDRRGKISVLNDLLREVDADIVVMSDANTLFARDAVRRLAGHFRDPSVGCVSGELSLSDAGGVSGEGLYWRYEGWIKRSEARLGFLIGCNGGIFAIRRSLYEPLPAGTIVEDFVLTLRIVERGYRVAFDAEARAIEPPCSSARAEMMRKVRIGAGGWQAIGLTRALLHPRYGTRAFAYWGHKVLRWSVPLLLVTQFAAGAFLWHSALYRAVLIGQALCIFVAACALNGALGRRAPRPIRAISYFYLMNYALLRGFLRYVFGTQRVTWERAATPAAGDGLRGEARGSLTEATAHGESE